MTEGLQDIIRRAEMLWQWLDAYPVLKYGILLAIVVVVIFKLTRWAFAPMSTKEKLEEQRRNLRRSGHIVAQANPSNGMEVLAVDFPVVIKLQEIDGEGNTTGRVLGYSIRSAPLAPVFLWLEGSWSRLDPIKSLHHGDIARIQAEIRDGIREELPDSKEGGKMVKHFRQISPPGQFALNGEVWKLDETLSFAGKLLRGQLFSFKEGKGLFELMSATRVGENAEENAIVLEKTVDEFRRAINETWICYSLAPSSEEEVRSEAGNEVLAPLSLPVGEPA